MKYFWRIVILCVIALVIALLVFYISFWNKAGAIIERSNMEQRVSEYADEPFSSAEQTIMKVTFPTSNDSKTVICPSFSTLVSKHSKMPSMGVSGHLALQWQSAGEPNSKIYTTLLERLFVACRLEKTYEQKLILKEYLSKAYFGAGDFGIDVAAQSIFAKPLAELGEQEGVALAALVKYPNLRRNPEKWSNLQDKLKIRLEE